VEPLLRVPFAIAFMLLAGGPAIGTAGAEPNSVRLGFLIARDHCSACHAILKTGESPQKLAPPFRDLHLRYPVEYLAEALAEGIRTGHPMMPEFRFDPDQAANLIAYLKTLER
jgi:mono/diheme cytochrome c family protein